MRGALNCVIGGSVQGRQRCVTTTDRCPPPRGNTRFGDSANPSAPRPPDVIVGPARPLPVSARQLAGRRICGRRRHGFVPSRCLTTAKAGPRTRPQSHVGSAGGCGGREKESGGCACKQGDVSGNSDMSSRMERGPGLTAVHAGVAATCVSLPRTHLPDDAVGDLGQRPGPGRWYGTRAEPNVPPRLQIFRPAYDCTDSTYGLGVLNGSRRLATNRRLKPQQQLREASQTARGWSARHRSRPRARMSFHRP